MKKLLVDGFTTKIACPTGSFRVLVYPVGAGNRVTSCDLRVFVDRAAEPVRAQNAHTGRFGRRMRASGGRVLLQRPVWPGVCSGRHTR